MKQVVVARSMNVQALLGRCAAPDPDVLNALRQLHGFPDDELTREDVGTEKDGYYTAVGGTTFVRCHLDGFAVVIVCHGNPQDVRVDILDQLDSWQQDDPRYEQRLGAMECLFARIVQDAGFSQLDMDPSDAETKRRLTGLDRYYGISQSLRGKDEEHLAVVALQGLGVDPFLRVATHEAGS